MKIGDWVVTPALNQLECDGRTLKLEPRPMELLVCLARHAGEVVSTDRLIAEVWNGRVIEESGVYKQINQLRSALGDDAQRPTFIETIPKRGYRLIAPVERDGGAGHATPDEPKTRGPDRTAIKRFAARGFYWTALGSVVAVVAAFAAWQLESGPRSESHRAAADGPLPNSVVVLPFDNLSPDPKDYYFALGMQDQIVNELTELGGLRVASRTSALRYAGSQKSASEIAQELRVATVLDGTVSYADGRVRVTAHLSDGATNEILWSESYEHELSNIFAIQSDIALEVGRALKAALLPAERERVERVPTTSVPAYLLYLQAVAREDRDTPEETLIAIGDVEQALELAADFSKAWVLDANLRNVAQFYDPEHGDEHRSRSLAAARRAVELDPELGTAHAALGHALSMMKDWTGGEAAYREALRRNVPLGDIPSYAFLQLAVADFARARETLGEARQLVPASSVALRFLVLANVYLGEWQLARVQYESGTRLFKPWREGEALRMHLIVGRDELEQVRAIRADDPINAAMIASLDSPQTALRELRRLYADPVASAPPTRRGNIAFWAAHFGDAPFALEAMRSAVTEQGGQAVYLWLPQFKQMRRLPEFKTLLRDVGIVAYWQKYGWPTICRPVRDDDFECD